MTKRELKITKALIEAHDFISAIADATEGGGRIDQNSIIRCGERLKTTAKRLDKKCGDALLGKGTT